MGDSVIPVGIFWDIENIRIPRGASPLHVIEALRNRFCDTEHVELEFQVVCDIRKESSSIIQILNSLQITIVHIDAVSKNAADDKLRQLIRRFGDVHGHSAKIVAITGDVNFATDLADLKRRKKVHIILLHNRQASEALLVAASEHYLFEDVVRNAAGNETEEKDNSSAHHEFVMYNIPIHAPYKTVMTRLNRLGSNTGCKVETLHRGMAILKFANRISAERARSRMDGSDVCGSKISTGKVRPSPLPELAKLSNEDLSREPSSEKECALPQVTRLPRHDLNLPEDSNSPLLTPKGFVMPSSGSSPYVHKMGPFPPPPNPVEVGVPAMMSSALPSQPQMAPSTSLGSSPESDPWMVSQILKDSPPPTLRTPDRYRSVKEKNTESFERYGYAFWNQTPEGYRRIRKADQESGERCQYPEGTPGVFPPRIYTGAAPLLGFPPPTHSAPPPLMHLPMPPSHCSSDVHDSLFRNQDATLDLHITNLDQSIQPNEMKRLLQMTFSQQVEVLQVLIHYLADGTYTACVRVPGQDAAQIAISNFHRRKIGKKRIMISYFNNQGRPSALLRSEVKSLLAEVPNCRLPLFRFREVFERRYNTSISVSDLYRMRDVVTISDGDGGGRMISLTKESRMSPAISDGSETGYNAGVCSEHYEIPKKTPGGWAEQEAKIELPNVMISLREFEPKIKALIESHNGTLYLNSLPHCYRAAFGTFPAVDETKGVPLEHLVTRVRGVRLVRGPATGVKHLEIAESPEDETLGSVMAAKPTAAPLASELELLSREVIDLLRSLPCCRIQFSKFIPSYHRHFGKQCRVANYGFTRLIDLLDAVSNVVQIIGDGTKVQLTLTASAQIKRFSADLLRVLKSQPGKQIAYSELPAVFEKAYARPFSPCNYGVCDLEDLMVDLTDTVVVLGSDEGKVVALPKREQTPEEIERTKQFSAESIELLSHAPEFRISFNKFIPAYHHHFGRQCKVSDHGFSKLIDLFEAIPEAVQTVDCPDGERWLQLTTKEQLRVLGNQLTTLIKMTKTHTLYLSELPELYAHVYGYGLKPETYEVESLEAICELVSGVVKILDTSAGRALLLVDKSHLGSLRIAVRNILGGKPDGKMNLDALLEELETSFGAVVSLKALTEGMDTVLKVSVDDNTAELAAIELLCRNIVTLLRVNEGRMPLASFDNAYLNMFGVPCRPAMYGFVSIGALLSSLEDVVLFKGKGPRKTLLLKFEAEKMYTTSVPPTPSPESKLVADKQDDQKKSSPNRESWNKPKTRTFRPQNHSVGRAVNYQSKDVRYDFTGSPLFQINQARPILPASAPAPVVPYESASSVPQPPIIHSDLFTAYPWTFQLGLNLQLGVQGTAGFPSGIVPTAQPNMFMVSGVPPLCLNQSGSIQSSKSCAIESVYSGQSS